MASLSRLCTVVGRGRHFQSWVSRSTRASSWPTQAYLVLRRRHLPWARLKTLSLLSQVQAQVAQKNVHRVEGRLARDPSLAVA